jgi:arginyl-tRNA synthetase
MLERELVGTLHRAGRAAAEDLGVDPGAVPEPELSRPRRPEHGDVATNLALVMAPGAGRPPRAVADAIAAHLSSDALIDRVEVAGPGFVNVFLRPEAYHAALAAILAVGEDVGRVEPTGRRAQV